MYAAEATRRTWRNPFHPGGCTTLVWLQVQTNGKKTPIQVVGDALQDLSDEVQDIRDKFQVGERAGGYSCRSSMSHAVLVLPYMSAPLHQ